MRKKWLGGRRYQAIRKKRPWELKDEHVKGVGADTIQG